ncbi:MAG: Hsp20/alpha crystallin family protein, partial [Euryarchaeota archaeon]|nr:Hsp20/alpha crystallin family protein [Euryarchaeota archaeon]
MFGRKDKPAVRTSERRGEITTRRPFELWMDLDRMFEQFRSSFDDLFWPFGRSASPVEFGDVRTPPMDVVDMGDRYEMKVEMPGISKEDIDIQVTSNGVEISARHEEEKEDKGRTWLRRERSSTGFYRSLEFPEEIRTDGVEAKLKNGVLTLSLPKL